MTSNGTKPAAKSGGDQKVRGEHGLTVYISHELKDQLKQLAKKYDRTMSDIVRGVLKIGIPMMEGLSRAGRSNLSRISEAPDKSPSGTFRRNHIRHIL
jgi:predicted DNA-binding protein